MTRPRMLDVRGWSLLAPSILAAVGFCAFAVLAFSFTELTALPAGFRRGLVVVGAFSLAIGGEVGTLAATVEIFRKRKTAEAWDWLALAISAVATVAAFILSFAALLGVSAGWSTAVKLYGPIVLGVFAAFDAYAGFAELGMYLSTYDERLAEWERKQAADIAQAAQDQERFRQAVAQGVQAALAEQQAEAQAERERRKAERQARQAEAQAAQVQAQAAQAEAQAVASALPDYASLDTFEAIKTFYGSNPLATQAQAAQAAQVSRARVGQVLQQLETAGQIRRNGHGVEVLK